MDHHVIEISGADLDALLAEIKSHSPIRTLRISTTASHAKVKIDHGIWSPPLGVQGNMPQPVCSECGEPQGEHQAGSLHCPIFADFAPDQLAGFDVSRSYVPLARL